MKYFVRYSQCSQSHNSAEATALALCKSYDGCLLLDEERKKTFIKQVEREIAQINKNCTKCRDLKFYNQKALPNETNSNNLFIGDVLCCIFIYKVLKKI